MFVPIAEAVDIEPGGTGFERQDLRDGRVLIAPVETQCGAVRAGFDPSSIGEICDLHDLASGVIGGPFADLFSSLEMA